MKSRRNVAIQYAVFVISFTMLCYEIVLNRIFAITQWHNFASVIISLALLGYGASGSIVFLVRKKVLANYQRWFLVTLIGYVISICLGFVCYQQIPFNPFELGIDSRQLWYLVLYMIAVGVPFFFGASVTLIAMLRCNISKTYFYNMVGSGIGAAFIVYVLSFLHPYKVFLLLVIIALLVAVMYSINIGIKTFIYCILFGITVLVGINYYLLNQGDRVSQYKAISYARNLPGAKVEHERFSPLGVVQVVSAPALRSSSPVSLLNPHELPIGKGIFYDGEGMSFVQPFDGNVSKASYLNYTPSVLPYYMLSTNNKKRSLIVGVGGGEGILRSMLHGFKSIDGIEINLDVVSLMQNELASYSGNIYNLPQVNIIPSEARGYIRNTNKQYDLIEISLLDAFNTAASGLYSLSESYLYTVESIKEYYQHLTDDGLLAISRWVMTPPRDNIKVFNTMIRALRTLGISDPGKHIVALRSMHLSTIVVSKKRISKDQILSLSRFARKSLFDVYYYDGIEEKDLNSYVQLDRPHYYNAAKSLLSDLSNEYEKEYLFDVRAATDNRPYFNNYFKLSSLRHFIDRGFRGIPIVEWGYFILIILLVVVLVLSFVLIVLPLLLIKESIPKVHVSYVLFFSLLGLGFFFVEMPLIQKLILFLSHPTYSLSVIIAGILVFSGIGSYFSDRVFKTEKRILFSSIMVCVMVVLSLLVCNYLLPVFSSKSEIVKVVITLITIMPLGFFMGIPFPQGLKVIKDMDETMLPWAWGINGFFNVISSILAAILAIMYGFNLVFVLAIGCYLLAGLISLLFAPRS